MVMKCLKLALLAGAFALAASTAAMAQTAPSATTVGSKISRGGNTTGGTAGSAAAGGTSASTIGLGANSTGRFGTSSTVGGAGSAAAVNGRAMSNTRIRENPQMLRAQSRASARDGGTWSQSMTNTKVRHNGDLSSWTRSMAHEPGSKPAMSRTRVR
jgi:hypothetical protein